MMRGVGMIVLVISGAAVAGAPAIEMVTVADPGNPADVSTGRGSIGVEFRIGLYEVTNPQYVAFLNAVAADDVHGLYETLMTSSDRGGILRSGSPGSYTYSVKPGFENKPVNSMTWLSAARFCNWLHNGAPSGAQGPSTTEDGAYDMSLPHGDIARKAGALWFLPTHNEWYKAAYYDPVSPGADGGGTPNYWLYPTMSDAQPVQATATPTGDVANPGLNVANYDRGADWNGENGNVTTVGGCATVGPWGAFDMAGNINEWTETLDVPIPEGNLPTRTIRGSDFASPGVLASSPEGFAPGLNMVAFGANVGFRVASVAMDAPCPADLDGDGAVSGSDLAILLGMWGAAGGAGDLDDDGVVGGSDLALLLGAWGACA